MSTSIGDVVHFGFATARGVRGALAAILPLSTGKRLRRIQYRPISCATAQIAIKRLLDGML